MRAFGLNRAELMTRRGESGDAVRVPRVLDLVGAIDHFEPMGEIPTGVKLTTFGSAVIGGERWVEALQEIVDLVEEGRVHANLDRTYVLDDIAAAHAYMEANRAMGKVVGIP